MFYVLMTRKTESCYTAVFQYIETHVFSLKPAEMMTDFEAGMRNSIKTVYPKTRLRGCWFHFCSALRKKSLRLGLRPLINSNRHAKLVFKELLSLPLLPAVNFVQGYMHIKKIAQSYGLLKYFRHFFVYFESFWLVEVNEKEICSFVSEGRKYSEVYADKSITNRREPEKST